MTPYSGPAASAQSPQTRDIYNTQMLIYILLTNLTLEPDTEWQRLNVFQ